MASQIGTATGKAKLEAVTGLVERLTSNLDKKSLSATERVDALDELKIYGRDPRESDPIFTKEGIHMLLQYAFDWTDETARAAQRVLANSMLLQPPTRQMFVDFGFESKACSALKSDHFDNQFLVSRIIFFSTYGTTVNLSELLTKHSLAQNIISDLAQHAKLLDAKHKGAQDQMQDMALAELLKLLFNITHFCKDKASLFDPAVKHIVPLFWKQDISDKRPFDPPFGPLVNALINLDFRSETAQAAFFPKDDATKVVARLSDLLDKGLKDYTGNDLEAIVAPLIGVVSDLYEQGPETAKASLRKRLLPTAEDRKNVLGKGDTLPSRLLKNSANPLAPKLATAISHLLFDLSDRDGHKFVENVGYGFASGFLFQNNIPVPASAQDGVKGTGQQRAVNPITGQFLDEEIYPDEIPMTDEEKEREAERLFVLFERLKRTGIVDIQNPVEQAVQQGKFRELEDNEVEELD